MLAVRRLIGLSLATLTPLMFLSFSGCASSHSSLNPSSPQATQISNLFWLIFGVAAAIFVIVEGLLFFAMIYFRRRRPDEEEPAQVRGNTRIEVAWTVVPAIILAGVLVMTFATMQTVTQRPASDVEVKVIGHQWFWEIQYPEQTITTATDLHVPVGEFVNIDVEAADVIHSFWVPELAGKIDAIPGTPNRTGFKADKANVYPGFCAEYCGTQHANMHFFVIAESPDDFAAWLKGQQAPAASVSGQAADGERFLMSAACITCHTINGTKAQGKVGPNLTHFASRRSIAAGTLDNTPQNLNAWLTNPQAVKPGNKMPNLNLSEEAKEQLVAYLEELK